VDVELAKLDLELNITKSYCVRIGERFRISCVSITSSSGQAIRWVDTIKYLGVWMVAGLRFNCTQDESKKSFNRAANSIVGRVGTRCTELVTIKLLQAKCLPILLYGLDTYVLNKTAERSLDFCYRRFLFRIFNTYSIDVIEECIVNLGLEMPSEVAAKRIAKFSLKYSFSENVFCNYVQLLKTCLVGGMTH